MNICMSTATLRGNIRDPSFLSTTIVELDVSFIEIRIIWFYLTTIETYSGSDSLKYRAWFIKCCNHIICIDSSSKLIFIHVFCDGKILDFWKCGLSQLEALSFDIRKYGPTLGIDHKEWYSEKVKKWILVLHIIHFLHLINLIKIIHIIVRVVYHSLYSSCVWIHDDDTSCIRTKFLDRSRESR